MKKGVLLLLLLSVGTCAFATTKSVKPQSSPAGILIVATFEFLITGDGISTTLTITPTRIPPIYADGVAILPKLPLVGVLGQGTCSISGTFTATVSGSQVIMNFPTAPPADTIQSCSVNLTYQPE